MYDMYEVKDMLFMDFGLCAYLHISLSIEVILSLFMSLCILSWIIYIVLVMTLNIYQVFGVSLEEKLIYVILFYFIYCIFFFHPQIIVFIYLFVHILEK